MPTYPLDEQAIKDRQAMGFDQILNLGLDKLISGTKDQRSDLHSFFKNQQILNQINYHEGYYDYNLNRIHNALKNIDQRRGRADKNVFDYINNMISNMFLEKNGSCYYDTPSYAHTSGYVSAVKDYYNLIKQASNTAAIKAYHYDESKKIASIKHKINKKTQTEMQINPLEGLAGEDGTLSLLTQLMESGESKLRGSSAEYKKIKSDIKVLNTFLTKAEEKVKKEGATFATPEVFMYAKLMLRNICENSAKYIKEREKDRFNESTDSYKGWRITLMREVYGRISARTEAVTALNGYCFKKDNPKSDTSKYYKKYLATISASNTDSVYHRAEKMMANKIASQEKTGNPYDYKNFEEDCNKLYSGLLKIKGKLPASNNVQAAERIIANVNAENNDLELPFDYSTGVPTDLKYKISEEDCRKMEDPDVDNVNDKLRKEYESNVEYETTFI